MDDELVDQRLRALASEQRRRLLGAIGDDETSVTDLVEATGLSQPATSQHLRVLRDAGVVQVRAQGNRRFYSVDGTALDEVRRALDEFWSGRLDDLARRAEARARHAARPGADAAEPREHTA